MRALIGRLLWWFLDAAREPDMSIEEYEAFSLRQSGLEGNALQDAQEARAALRRLLAEHRTGCLAGQGRELDPESVLRIIRGRGR